MGKKYSFIDEDELKLEKDIIENGYTTCKVENKAGLDSIRNEVVKLACLFLKKKEPKDKEFFLNNFHKIIEISKLNDLRLFIYNTLNTYDWFAPTYYSLGKKSLAKTIGNELVMQRKINLSIQCPRDKSSVLPVHADQQGGESPYQFVLWVPLVDVSETKSMFMIPPNKSREFLKNFTNYAESGFMQQLIKDAKNDLKFLSVNYGELNILNVNNFHGNIINETQETRWSFNVRFKSLFSPYTSEEKSLGSFYHPISTKAATKIGMNYEQVKGFKE